MGRAADRAKMKRVFLIIVAIFTAAACVKPTPEELDTDPVIEAVTLNYSQLNKSLFIAAEVFDPQGVESIDSVIYYLFRRDSIQSDNETLFRSGRLYDIGPPLDIIRYDGVFSYLIDSTQLANNEGYYRVSVQAFDEDGNSSSIEEQETLVSPNSPPALYPLEIPRSFEKGDFVVFKIRVSDPQGYQDIAAVLFTVLRPDGTYRTDPSFFLSDAGPASGGWGDEIAGDGIFTTTIPTNANSHLQGDFTFYFYAEDIHGAVSDTLRRVLTNPGVHLTAPDNAITLTYNQTYTIEWESAYVNQVTIQYTTNANAATPEYTTITTTAAVLGAYEWTVPAVRSSECKVKIFDPSNPRRFDVSDNNFSISP